MKLQKTSTLLIPVLGALALGLSSANAAVIVNEQFADGNRNNQSPNTSTPQDSLQWRIPNSTPPTGQTFNSGVWTMTPSASNWLTAQFNSVTLSSTVTSVTFSFNYSITAPASGNFIRFGLFNSGGSFPAADGSATAFAGDVGYTVFGGLPASTVANSFTVRKESNTDGALFGTNPNNATVLGTGNLGAVTASQTYLASLTITRNSPTSISLSSTLNGVTVNATDLSNTNQTFDNLGIFFGNNMGNISLSNVMITTVTSAVPEPSSFALIAGAAGLGFGALRRRRRA